MRGITRDTVVELTDRKFLWIFGAITVITALVIFLASQADISFSMQSGGDFGGQDDITSMAGAALLSSFDFFITILIFLTVMATAGLLPHALERGRADFYIAKPISRRSLLLGKFFGLWSVYGAALAVCALIVWAVGGLAFGNFDVAALWVIAFGLIDLFIWLSVTVLVGVWTGSTAMAMMSAILIWVLQRILSYREAVSGLTDSKLAITVVNWLYYIVPKPSAIADIGIALARGRTVDDWLPLWSSLLFSAALVVLAVVVFKRKDY